MSVIDVGIIFGGELFIGPTADGTAGQVIQTDGAGQLSFVDAGGGASSHAELTDLEADDHAQYALLSGRSGGQTLFGGKATGTDSVADDLVLSSGISTGSADPANVVVRVTSPGSSGSTPQTEMDMLTISEDGVNVANGEKLRVGSPGAGASLRSNGLYFWYLESDFYGLEIFRNGSGGLVLNSSKVNVKNGLNIQGGTGTPNGTIQLDVTPNGSSFSAGYKTGYIKAQKGGNYADTNPAQNAGHLVIKAFDGGNTLTGDSDGGEGGSVSVEYGYGGIGVGTGVDGTPGFFVVRTSAGDDVLKMDTDDTAGNTRMLIYDVDSGSLERVKVGSNNSGPGGSGRALYIDNN